MTLNTDELTPEQELDDAFDEFSGDGGSSDLNDNEFDRPRDDLGRFAASDDPGDEEDEDLPLAAENGDNPGDQNEKPELTYQERFEQAQRDAQNWQHRYNSDLGRQSALQRKIDEQNQLIEQLKSSGQKPADDNPDGSGMSDSQWDALREDFPEMAIAIEAKLEAKLSGQANQYQKQLQEQQQTISQLQQQMQPIQQQAQDQYLASQFQILEQKHPDYQNVAGSAEFNTWLSQQPEVIQNLRGSEDAADAAYLLDSFKLSSIPAKPHNDDLRQRRQRTLEASQTIPNKSARRTAVAEDDLDAAFDYYASK